MVRKLGTPLRPISKHCIDPKRTETERDGVDEVEYRKGKGTQGINLSTLAIR